LQDLFESYDDVAELSRFKDSTDVLLCWYSGEIEVEWHGSFEGWVEVVLGSDVLENVWAGKLVHQ